jgi:septal ring factor EnvC (AmiA/AmiB activator)
MNERVPDIVRKDRPADARAAAPKPKSEPDDLVFGRRHLPGSVDLAHAASLPEWASQPARIQDVAYSIDAASDAVIEATVEFVNKKLDERAAQTARLEKRFADLEKRLTLAELEAAALKSENARLERDIAALNQTQRARRGPKPAKPAAKDPYELPPALLRKAARIKRKVAGATAEPPP